jgi:hypothetical protein
VEYRLDVLLHPLQSLDHVLEPVVQRTLVFDLLRGQEAVRTNAVVEGDDHNVVARGLNQATAVVVGIAQRVVAAALDEKVDWQVGGIGRRKDIQEQAVLRLGIGDGIGGCGDAHGTVLTLSMCLYIYIYKSILGHTARASCTPVSTSGSCGAAKRKLPVGAAA